MGMVEILDLCGTFFSQHLEVTYLTEKARLTIHLYPSLTGSRIVLLSVGRNTFHLPEKEAFLVRHIGDELKFVFQVM
jgi:hypothetical protein